MLLPADHGHAEKLWDRLPPYYQFTDEQENGREGVLRRFLAVFGFELDLTRQYVESQQEVYQSDRVPVRLLQQLGTMFDVKYKGDLGDIRYRALVSQIAELYSRRGTVGGLEQVITAATGYDVDVTPGVNRILLPDSSDFFNGTGSWANYFPGQPSDPPVTSLANLRMYVNVGEIGPVNMGAVSRVMEVYTVNPVKGFTLSLGYGDRIADPRDTVYQPIYSASVRPVSIRHGCSSWEVCTASRHTCVSSRCCRPPSSSGWASPGPTGTATCCRRSTGRLLRLPPTPSGSATPSTLRPPLGRSTPFLSSAPALPHPGTCRCSCRRACSTQ